MNIVEATQSYENWLLAQLERRGLAPDAEALNVKHDEIARAPFAFLRGTFYRWVERFSGNSPLWRDAPILLSIGDLHLANFGTWRDGEGRLVWGVNDFDEACPLPYTNDLVRLATGVRLGLENGHALSLDLPNACRQILSGYALTLQGGKAAASPLVLSESNAWLGEIAANEIRDPARFWNKLDQIPPSNGRQVIAFTQSTRGKKAQDAKGKGKNTVGAPRKIADAPLKAPLNAPLNASLPEIGASPDGAIGLQAREVPDEARAAIETLLPPGMGNLEWKRRQAGLGSLGRPRFVALGVWQGGRIAREAKALLPPALFWMQNGTPERSFTAEIIAGAVRCPDPLFQLENGWLVRRLSPDCTRLELFDVPKRRQEAFLFAMGREVANIHFGTVAAIPAVLKHLKPLPATWLEEAAQECAAQTLKDWQAWREHHRAPRSSAKKRL